MVRWDIIAKEILEEEKRKQESGLINVRGSDKIHFMYLRVIYLLNNIFIFF